MELPRDIRKPGKIWKFKKPLYGLNDASRKFWLKVKEVFSECGLQILKYSKGAIFEDPERSIPGDKL